jgi:hypothetical protein
LLYPKGEEWIVDKMGDSPQAYCLSVTYRFASLCAHGLPRLNRRRMGFVLFLIKEPKSNQTGCFFAAQALCAAKPEKPRARSFCPLLSHKAYASGKITNALAAAQSNLFYRISPKAARLTALSINKIFPNSRFIGCALFFYVGINRQQKSFG